MGRQRNTKKFRAHAPAAQSTAAKTKKPQANASASVAAASVAAEAAVKAAFAGDDGEIDAEELVPVDGEDSGDEDDATSGMSRGQRKRMKRRSAFMKKMGMVQRVVSEKEKDKKKQEQGAFAEIKELQDSLFLSDKELAAIAASKISQSTNVTAKSTTSAAAALKPKKLSGKQRQKLAVRELGQLKAVHTHPQFQTDPFAAIQMHLQNTVVQANQATIDKQKASAGASKAKAKNAMDVE